MAVETYSDQVLNFSIPSRHVRGRVVRLDDVLNTILDAHDYPPAIAHLLAEAVVLCALIGGLIKDDNAQMTMQAQMPSNAGGDASCGAVSLLVSDFRRGELRGYVEFDRARLERLGANPSLKALFGNGYLTITFDRGAEHGRYQGIVPLEGESLAVACERYFAQSEQLPSLIRVAVVSEGKCRCAAGLLIQHLADGEEGRERLHVRHDHREWEHAAVIAASLRHEELLDPALSMEALVWRLFHEEAEVRIQPGVPLTRGCRCSIAHYTQVLNRFPEEDRADMRDDTGTIPVNCAFCSRIFAIPL